MPGTVKKLQFSEGTDVGAPTDLSLQTSTSVILSYANDAAYVMDQAAQEGSVYLNTTTNKFRMYVGGAWRNAVPESDSTDETKVFLVDVSGNTTGISATIKFVASATRVYTFPNGLGDDDVVLRTLVQVLTNKELTAPLLDQPTIKGNANIASIDVETATDDLEIGASADDITIGGASSEVIIPGNLTVNGTTTSINTTNLEVTDKNILMNNGGNDASSEGAGITVERTATNATILFENALASKFKAGLAGSEVELANVSSAQTITNKRMHLHTTVAANDSTSPRLVVPQNTLANLQTITGGNHPSEGALYYATDIDRYYYWDGSSLLPVGSGSGSGEINYVTNPDAEANVASVSTYADAAATTPVDGTGGSPNVTVTRNTTTPLRGNADFALAKGAANRQGEGWSWDLGAVSLVDRSKKLKLQFDYDFTDSNYVSGDVTVFIYDITNTTIITPQNNSIPKAAGTHIATFDATTSSSYRAIFHVATTNATAYTLKVDSVVVGPGAIAKGAVVSDWLSYSPTITGLGGGTATVNFAQYRRVGSTAEIMMDVSIGGSPSGATTVLFPLPSGLTIDFLGGSAYALTSNPNWYHAGNWISILQTVVNSAVSTTAVNITIVNNTTIVGASNNAGDIFRLHFTVPVAEWSGNGTVNLAQNDVEYAWNSATADSTDTTSFGYGPAGVQFGSFTANRLKTVAWQKPIQQGDQITLEIWDTNSWLTLGSYSSSIVPFYTSNNTEYGMGLENGPDNTKTIVQFAAYRSAAGATTYAVAGLAWSGIAASANFKWRAKKVSGGVAVGFGAATADSMGLVKANRVETRVNASSTSTDGTALFNFSSLTAGKRYRVYFTGKITMADNSGQFGYARVVHNSGGTVVQRIGSDPSGNQDAGNRTWLTGVVDIPALVGTVILVDWSATDATSGITDMTCTLEEVNDSIATSFGT